MIFLGMKPIRRLKDRGRGAASSGRTSSDLAVAPRSADGGSHHPMQPAPVRLDCPAALPDQLVIDGR